MMLCSLFYVFYNNLFFTDIIQQLKLRLPDNQSRNEAVKILNSAGSLAKSDMYPVLNSLLQEIDQDDKTVSPNSESIQKYCKRFLEFAQKCPPILIDLQNQINEEKGNYIVMNSASNDSLEDGTCINNHQPVTSTKANMIMYREQLAMKDAQLRRLEEEIANAHRCV
ncbi:unnamed protein product [Thelazia callipaeda]|uniref:Uncharacterized protein n=1 Tax=Thelazia callipaeda TaxID=103827 RepID=A0A0N5DA74_THECL|nr:unnamed protein product [Thelazia callipaeda]